MTPELEKVKRITDNYIALKKAIDNPNFPSTAHTQAVLLKDYIVLVLMRVLIFQTVNIGWG